MRCKPIIYIVGRAVVSGGLVVVCLCLSSCSLTARLRKADKKYAIGEYYDAGEMYRQLYSKVPQKQKDLRAQVAFKQGECQRILNNTKATTAYKNAIKYHYPDSVVYLRYAQALQYQGKYREAAQQYDLYLQAYPDSYVAQAGRYACHVVGEWRKSPTRYTVTPAKEFNTKRTSNLAPAFTDEDGSRLVFTSNRTEQTKSKKKVRSSPVTGATTFNLYSARKNAAGQWEDIELCEGLYEEQEAEASGDGEDSGTQRKTNSAELGVCCFTPDGRTMYFTFSCPVNGQDLGTKIYMSSRTGGAWGEAQEVKLFADSSITVGHPALCPTGDTLYFVSDAPGGFGGKDIYRAVGSGTDWSDIENLGAQINTADDELYPFVRADGRLFFSSKGHPGYGGLDLFYANRVDTAWEVFNMGMPFNSQYDDFGIAFAGSSESGFFTSNRADKQKYDQLYRFVLPALEFFVEGIVADPQGEPVADAAIRLVGDDGTNVRTQVRRDGTYRLRLQQGVRYIMLSTARGYLNARDSFNTLRLKDSKTYTQDFTLAPISKPVTMNNIFYEFGKWDISLASEQGLQALVKLLNDNPNITIELSAHTDMKGDSVFNATLSDKRAKAVCAYLIQQGIDAERLTPVGYGKQKPVTADQALHKQYPFIPVGQALDETFILSLPADQQETCNQINRRTEFKVLRTTYKLY